MKGRIGFYAFQILISICIVILFYFSDIANINAKIVYIDAYSLFENYSYSKEIGKKLDQYKEAKEKEIEQLKADILKLTENISKGSDEAEIEKLKGKYLGVVSRANEDYELVKSKYEGQVWDKLNSYVAEYGEMKGYRIILGATGNGSIMYASKGIDITEELIDFCNKKENSE